MIKYLKLIVIPPKLLTDTDANSPALKFRKIKNLMIFYRKRLNNGPPFLRACTLFMYEIHA